MLKELLSLIIKIAVFGAIILGIIWFLKEGTVIIDKGKEHSIIGR
jgi:hypothetical protein